MTPSRLIEIAFKFSNDHYDLNLLEKIYVQSWYKQYDPELREWDSFVEIIGLFLRNKYELLISDLYMKLQ
jgi:hypothetical protein